MTDKAIKLELEEIPIEEIQMEQEVTAKGDGICNRLAVYKLNLLQPAYILCEWKNSGNDVKHFNKEKRRVRCPENDARYFFQESELNTFLKQINYPEKIWVSTIKNDDGSFFAYRVGRIIPTKKGLKKI